MLHHNELISHSTAPASPQAGNVLAAKTKQPPANIVYITFERTHGHIALHAFALHRHRRRTRVLYKYHVVTAQLSTRLSSNDSLARSLAWHRRTQSLIHDVLFNFLVSAAATVVAAAAAAIVCGLQIRLVMLSTEICSHVCAHIACGTTVHPKPDTHLMKSTSVGWCLCLLAVSGVAGLPFN